MSAHRARAGRTRRHVLSGAGAAAALALAGCGATGGTADTTNPEAVRGKVLDWLRANESRPQADVGRQ